MMPRINTNAPLVSISCLTYNHAKYISQCLDGFLMQETEFPYEILIHDDASTDGTEEIIREYQAKYPLIIRPIYEEENQWLKGRRGSPEFNFPRAKGKYIALCEGDDYWTDSSKLQQQVEILENNPSLSATCHDTSLIANSSVVAASSRLGHTGPCDVDVIVRDGTPYLIECNPRFGGHYPFAHLAGANVPRFLLSCVSGTKIDSDDLRARPGITHYKEIAFSRSSQSGGI